MADFWKIWDRFRLRAVTADPSSLSDGEQWYNSTDARFKFRQNGATVSFPAAAGALIGYVVFTGSGTYTKNANATYIRVTVVGGGGAGGGTVATGASTRAEASSGGGGGTAIERISNASVGATETVTIGAGGTGASGAIGGNGGTSSFGAFCSATGGGGGQFGTDTAGNADGPGGGGGVGSGGDINFRGSGGSSGVIRGGIANFLNNSGGSFMGGSRESPNSNTTTGGAGYNYGGGATGARAANSVAAQAGADGAPGVVIVEEFA